jgi:hypothetical protein
MTVGAGTLALTLGVLGYAFPVLGAGATWPVLLSGWGVLGAAYAMCVTPAGRLLKRSSVEEDRPALFAAQFALSHVCWLIAYPVAGQVGAQEGMAIAFQSLAVLALVGTGLAVLTWPRSDPVRVPHDHPELPSDHPHLRQGHRDGAAEHDFVIDAYHPRWPR